MEQGGQVENVGRALDFGIRLWYGKNTPRYWNALSPEEKKKRLGIDWGKDVKLEKRAELSATKFEEVDELSDTKWEEPSRRRRRERRSKKRHEKLI